MATTFYLKKQDDVITDGNHLYNANNSLSVDAEYKNINLGAARRKHEMKKLIGNGQKVIESIFRNPQEIKASKQFFSDGTDNSFDDQRRMFLRDWVYTQDITYLYRNENDRLTRRRVWLDITGSEKYDYYPISNDINFVMISEKPFFDNIVEITELYTKTGSLEEIAITNDGEFTPFIVNFTFGSGASQFIVKTFDNRAVQINYSFSNTMILKIDLSDLTIFINGIERTNLSVVGSPFNLAPGDNTVKIISSAPGSGSITYNERYT